MATIPALAARQARAPLAPSPAARRLPGPGDMQAGGPGRGACPTGPGRA